ncbi:MAG: ABC transporter permease, partial [Alphaproteobacteria bacterium]
MINFAVLHKELRQKLQGWMAFSILCGYLLIAAIITFFVIIINKKTLLCEIGNSLTLGLFIFQSFAIMLISITLASIMISQERGKQTYETLLSSPVSRLNIIFGKLAAHWFFLSAVVISVFGPGAICILLGGVNLTDLLALYLILLMSALLWGAFGIYFSSIFKKTYSAIFVAVIFILAMLFATGIFAEIKGISAFFFPFSAGWAISKHTEFFWFNIKIPLLPIFIFIQFVIISLLINESVRRLYLKDLKIFSVIRKSLWAGLWIFSLVLSLGFADTLMRSGWGLFGGIIAKQYIFLLIISIVSLPVICG